MSQKYINWVIYVHHDRIDAGAACSDQVLDGYSGSQLNPE